MRARSPKELAALIASQRKKLKLSQSAVAKRVGLKQQTISQFENNPEGTQLSTLFYILSAVNLDIKILSKSDTSNTKTEWKEEW